MPSVLESYLLKLGFDVDQPGLLRFSGAIAEAGSSVSGFLGVGADLLGWQAKATGLFVGLGAAVGGLVDHVAVADQNYRLMALHMFTTTGVARELDITTKALGASLDEITWDPELHARAVQLFKDQERIVAGTGGSFEKNMKSIRDMRFQFQRLGVILQYGSFAVVNDVFERLAGSVLGFTGNFRDFNDWLIENLPEESQKLADWIVDQVGKVRDVIRGLRTDLSEAGTLFIHTVGLLAGDKNLAGAKLSWESIGKAISDSITGLANFAKGMEAIEAEAGHLLNAGVDAASGHPIQAIEELNKAKSGMGTQFAVEGAATVAGAIGGSFVGMPFLGAAAGFAISSNIERGFHPTASDLNRRREAAFKDAAIVSKNTGVPANFIFDQWADETDNFRHLKGRNNPGNLEDRFGVMNIPTIGTFLHFDEDYFNKRPWLKKAANLRQFSSELGQAHYFGIPGQNGAPTVAEYAARMAHFEPEFQSLAGSVTVQNQTINIQAPPGSDARDIAKYIHELNSFQTQKNLAQAGSGSYQ